MDSDAVIGRLYVALHKAEEERNFLMTVVAGIKSGEIDLSRIEVGPNSISVSPAERPE